MILGFTSLFDGKPLNFIEKISRAIKLHTLREDVHERWNDSRTIQFCTGVRTKKYKEHFSKPCTGTQLVKLILPKNNFTPYITDLQIVVNGKPLNPLMNQVFIKNDGFSEWTDFMKWFFFEKKKGKWVQTRTEWTGKIIHWTELRY